jgi:hypothetical protein
MQISGVSLALTWPCRLCLLRVLLCGSLCYKLSPFQALGEVTLHPRSQACLFIYSSCGKWVFPHLLCSFPPTATFTSFPAPDYWVVLLLLPATMFVYSSHGRWVFPPLCGVFLPPPFSQAFPLLVAGRVPLLPPEALQSPGQRRIPVLGRIPLPQSLALSVPHPLSCMSYLFLLLSTQFLFFPRVEVSLSRGLCCSGPGLSVGITRYCKAHLVRVFLSHLSTSYWRPRGPPCFSI